MCAVVSNHCGEPCPRAALGVIAASRGALGGSVTLLNPDGSTTALDRTQMAIPGDPEEIAALRFCAPCRARYILVVEKDTVFNRLTNDGFVHHLPSVLVTGRGYPDLATRALVQHLSDALDLDVYVLTDWNPHGVALMLTYKHGSASFGLEHYHCAHAEWLGVRSTDVDELLREAAGRARLDEALQPFTRRDAALADRLLDRATVQADDELCAQVRMMAQKQKKLEIEAVYDCGFDFLVHFLVGRIVGSGNAVRRACARAR